MKKRKFPSRGAMTLLLAALVFCVLTVTVGLVGMSLYALMQAGVLTISPGNRGWGGMVLLSFGLSSIIVGTVISLLVGHIPLKRLNSLVKGLEALAAGNYQARIDFGECGEPSNLAGKFNLLAEELQNTELFRTDFINNFSHEFKTPIVSILGFAKLLNRGNLTPEQSKEYLSIIEEEAGRLAAMSSNVLDVNRFENQRILTDVASFNLSEQLRTCVLLLEKGWSAKELQINAIFPEYQISANQDLLKRVWINLLDNAVKFSPEGGQVDIGIEARPDSLVVTISNQGPPIPEKDRERVFHKFYQGDPSRATRGNGLGLAMAKRIVELHRGRIWVDSQGKTVCFSVELPRNVSAEAP